MTTPRAHAVSDHDSGRPNTRVRSTSTSVLYSVNRTAINAQTAEATPWLCRSRHYAHKSSRDDSDLSGIVHLAYIDQLLASTSCDVLRIFLACQRLDSRFDGVHRVSRSSYSRVEVMDTGAFGNLPDVLLDTKAESYRKSVRARVIEWEDSLPGGLAYSSSSVAPTFPLTSPKIVLFSYRKIGFILRTAR